MLAVPPPPPPTETHQLRARQQPTAQQRTSRPWTRAFTRLLRPRSTAQEDERADASGARSGPSSSAPVGGQAGGGAGGSAAATAADGGGGGTSGDVEMSSPAGDETAHATSSGPAAGSQPAPATLLPDRRQHRLVNSANMLLKRELDLGDTPCGFSPQQKRHMQVNAART